LKAIWPEPVIYPVTHLRPRAASRLTCALGRVRLLLPPGIPAEVLGAGPGGPIIPVEFPVSPEQERVLRATLADYLRWAEEHPGISYSLFLREEREREFETRGDVTRRLRGEPHDPRRGAPKPPPGHEDLGWQVLTRLAHDYEKQQEEIDRLLGEVREKELELGDVTGLGLDQLDTGPAEYERLPGDVIPPETAPDELAPGGRLWAFAHLWSRQATDSGALVTTSTAAYEELAGLRKRLFPEETPADVFSEPVLELPDAASMSPERALAFRSEDPASGPFSALDARLSALRALLQAREWDGQTKDQAATLASELEDAARRVRDEASLPGGPTLLLRVSLMPVHGPEDVLLRLAGKEPLGQGGISLLVETPPGE